MKKAKSQERENKPRKRKYNKNMEGHLYDTNNKSTLVVRQGYSRTFTVQKYCKLLKTLTYTHISMYHGIRKDC